MTKMEAIIKITENNGSQVVSARELHQFLETETRFDIWIKRMFEYGFTQNVDYQCLIKIVHMPNGGTKEAIDDYAISVDCAKEIAMIQRTDKGKQARQYFIEMEKKYNNPSGAEYLLRIAQNMVEHERKIKEIATKTMMLEDDMQLIKIQTATRPDYFTIMGYSIKSGKKVNLAMASEIGRKAAKLCNEYNYPIDKVADPRFGYVNMYPTEVLKSVFDHVFIKEVCMA